MPANAEQAELGQRTRAALVAAARELFSTKGYLATSTAEIVTTARLTRGALYHHFSGKDELFRVVFVDVCHDLRRDAERRREHKPPVDAWAALRATIDDYVQSVSTNPELRRVVIIDGPAVLGWTGWRELSGPYSSNLIQTEAERAMREGVIRNVPPDTLAQILLAAINEGSSIIAESDDTHAAIRSVEATLGELLEGLRTQPA